MKVDGDNVFFGFVFKQQRTKDKIITVTAYDQLRYLKIKIPRSMKERRQTNL